MKTKTVEVVIGKKFEMYKEMITNGRNTNVLHFIFHIDT